MVEQLNAYPSEIGATTAEPTVPSARKTAVVHISSHHQLNDGRVFYRECRSMAKAGFDVSLVIPHSVDETIDEVKVCAIPRYRNRLERFLIMPWRAVSRALKTDADIYHFHDPELMLPGLWLRLRGKAVIYDIHEDFSQAALVREWVPNWFRKSLSTGYGLVEKTISHAFHLVIAERYYARKFPRSTEVLNHPDLDLMQDLREMERDFQALTRPRLIYTGSVTASRGAIHHARLVAGLDDGELYLVGYCRAEVKDQLLEAVPENRYVSIAEDGTEQVLHDPAGARSTVFLVGLDRYVAPQDIWHYLGQEWTAGLAIFPDTEHYREKELTKFFEYMLAALPCIVSDFPTWRELVQDNQVGFAVPPDEVAPAVAAVHRLMADPAHERAMGHRGRQLVIERYNWTEQAKNLAQLYRSIMAKSTRQSKQVTQ